MVTAMAGTAVAVTTTAGTAGTVTGGTDISGGDWPLATAARLRCDSDSAHHRGSREAIDHESARINPRTSKKRTQVFDGDRTLASQLSLPGASVNRESRNFRNQSELALNVDSMPSEKMAEKRVVPKPGS